MATKSFDCVEAKHRAAAEVQAETAGMTPEQQVAFWREQTAKWREELLAARDKRAQAKTGPEQAVRETLRRAIGGRPPRHPVSQ